MRPSVHRAASTARRLATLSAVVGAVGLVLPVVGTAHATTVPSSDEPGRWDLTLHRGRW
jgi:hypothetical protein